MWNVDVNDRTIYKININGKCNEKDDDAKEVYKMYLKCECNDRNENVKDWT